MYELERGESMDKEKAKERYLKLKALAERGVGGEKETAKRMLEKHMKKYGIEIESLGEEKKNFVLFSYNGFLEERLLSQCIYKTLGKETEFYRQCGKRNKIGAYCTKAQQIEINLDFDFYKEKMYDDAIVFLKAFIIKNDIYPKDGAAEPEGNEEETKEDKQAVFMATMLEKHIRNELIE